MQNKFIYLSALLILSSILIFPTNASLGELESFCLPVKKSKQAVLEQMIADCQQFIDFEEEHLQFARAMNEKEPGYVASLELFESYIEFQRQIKRILENFNMETSDPEKLLSSLLDVRLRFLYNRTEKIVSVREKIAEVLTTPEGSIKNKRNPIFGPTRPEFFDALDPQTQFLARASTDRYQSINKHIITLWQLIDPRSLKAQTKLKVRCSTTLWANLTGERDYLGHPDEAIITYENELFPFKKDCENYNDYLSEWQTQIELLGWGKGKTSEIFVTPYDRSLTDPDFVGYGKIEEAPYPDWLMPLPQNFLRAESSQIVKESGKEPCLQKTIKSKKSSRARSPSKKPAIHREQRSLPETKTEKISLSEAGLKDRLALNHPGDAESSVLVSEKANGQLQASEQALGIDISNPLNEQHEEKENAESLLPYVPKKPEEIENGKEEIGASDTSHYQEYALRPRGMRIFHPQQSAVPLEPLSIMNLRGKIEETRQKIFDSQMFQNVTFREFKTLWKHICGPRSVIESNGSSHKKLIGPCGEVFGTYAHGDSMTYGHKSIQYIRDALTQIGYGG